jgi:hypothetical protein
MLTAGGSGTMSIAAGQAADSTNAVMMSTTAIAKTTSAWAVGTGNGGLDTGGVAINTWYHFFLIMRPDTGVVDVLFSTLGVSPHDAGELHLQKTYRVWKDRWQLAVDLVLPGGRHLPVGRLLSRTTPRRIQARPLSARALTVPTGVVVLPIHSVLLTQGGTAAATYCLISSLATTDTAPSATLFTLATGTDAAAVQNTASQVNNVTTNTSAQIRTRVSNSAAGTTLSGSTQGWVDHRGRDA